MSSPTPPPPPARDAQGRPVARDGDTPYQHRHDEKLDYTTEHTAADPEHVRREEYVDNDDKRLPTDNRTTLWMSIAATVLAVLAIIVAFPLDLELVGLILGILAIILAGLATLMAFGDARASPITPALVTIAALIVTVLIALDMGDAEDIDPDGVNRVIVDDDVERSELTDGDADLGDGDRIPRADYDDDGDGDLDSLDELNPE